MRRKLAAGNWKMNGTRATLGVLDELVRHHPAPQVDLLICPPATLLAEAHQRLSGTPLRLGGQDCHSEDSGAHTGDIAAPMLADAGATAVILGHSERRQMHGESSALVCAKARVAARAGLCAIICVGETMEERDSGSTLEVIGAQLSASVPDTATGETTVIAYEPVWAIGTGRTATPDQIGAVHDFLRDALAARFGPEIAGTIRLLYGGSVKPANAAEIFAVPNVNGALVGGASLKAADFTPIITALEAAPDPR